MSDRTARTMIRAGAVAALAAAVLAGCRPRPAPASTYFASEAATAEPGTTPWFCSGAGTGTPISGHGNGSHVHSIYEGRTKGPLPPEDCAKLTKQLDETLGAVRQWDTRAKGEAAGWYAAAEYIEGLGTHHVFGQNNVMAGLWNTAFDHRKPMFLIYGGPGGDAPLIGVAFGLAGSVNPPEGYVGGNDWWHRHAKICLSTTARTWPPTILAGAEEIPDADCTAQGGFNAPVPGGIWLLHMWIIPPYEYKLDIFVSGHTCLLPSGTAPLSDPCWEIAHRDPALGMPAGAGGDHGGDEHGDHGH